MLGQIRFIQGPLITAASYIAKSSLSTVVSRLPNLSTVSVFHPATVRRSLLPAVSPMSLQVAEYKVKVKLKRRCAACYYVRRGERLFVECLEKPRHKQMQKMSKAQLKRMRED